MNALFELAKKYNKPLFIFDLETSDFLTGKSFGITEISALIIKPDGMKMEKNCLVNPEQTISRRVFDITGISNKMVANQPNYAETDWHRFFRHAAKTAIVIGFNIFSFDIPCVFRVSNIYGLDKFDFLHLLDVRDVHHKCFFSSDYRLPGKLTDIARSHGIDTSGAHRATADVMMTAMVLNSYLEQGVDVQEYFAKMEFGEASFPQQCYPEKMAA